MLDEGIGTGGLGQIDAGTWTATEGNQVAELLEIITVGITCGKYDVGDVLLYLFIDINLAYHLTRTHYLFGGCHRHYLWKTAHKVFTHNLLLLFQCGIVYDDLEHETVYLGFGKLVGAFLFNGVLGSHNQEGSRQLERIVTNSHLVFLHGLEQSALHLGGSSVYLIGKYKIGKYFGVKPVVVSAGIKTGIRIVTENPRQVGPDRIVDAVGAYTLYGGPAIVVDFGTATTFDVIGPDGTFEAGVIAPGIRTSAQSLWGEADMLPAIEIRKPKSILAKETITAMQAGLVYGQIGQTEYIIRRMKEESGYPNAKVVATGGLGKMIANETDMIDVYDSQLTLKGLRFIYEKNKKSK